MASDRNSLVALKKFENHWAALCLYFAYYNFCRIHSTIRVTPAMEAGITDHVWDLAELLARTGEVAILAMPSGWFRSPRGRNQKSNQTWQGRSVSEPFLFA
jgi:hypothetical protein